MDLTPNTNYPQYPNVRFDPELVELKTPGPARPRPNVVATVAAFALVAVAAGVVLAACL